MHTFFFKNEQIFLLYWKSVKYIFFLFCFSSVRDWNQSSETSAPSSSQGFWDLSVLCTLEWLFQLHYPQSWFPSLCGWLVNGAQLSWLAEKRNSNSNKILNNKHKLIIWCLMFCNHTWIFCAGNITFFLWCPFMFSSCFLISLWGDECNIW